MNKNTKARITTIAAGAALLAVVGGGSAVAGSLVTSAGIKDNTIRSADVLNGGLRGVDIKDASIRGADVADGSLTNQDVGVLYASVDSTGQLDASSGNVQVSRTDTGEYTVDFGRDITKCAFTATAGGVGVGIEEGTVNVSQKSANTGAVYVWTQDADSVDDDIDFHLVVVC